MSVAIDYSSLAETRADGSRRLDLALDGLTCAACIYEIEAELKTVPGLAGARANYEDRRLTLEWRDASFAFSEAAERLRRMGYRARPFERASGEREAIETSRHLLRCFAVAAFAAVNVMLLSEAVWIGEWGDLDSATRDFFHGLSALIAIPASAYAGQPFFTSAFAALRAGRLNIDVPISLGVLLALAMSVYETIVHAPHAYFDSAIMLLAFLLLGRWLDSAVRRKTRAVAANLAALRAPIARRIGADGSRAHVPPSALAPGDVVEIAPGERIPADGVIFSGRSSLDESLVTGETSRRAVAAGDHVYAGSLAYEGALTMRVEAACGGSLIDEIERLVEEATAARSRYLQLADRVTRLYAPAVHVTAAATAIGWLAAGASTHDALVAAIAVLIVTCPCALALAAPAVQVVASGALFRAGVLLSRGDALERLAEVDTVVFDKTGTLTTPEPRLVDPASIDEALVEIAARLAHSSSHPLARALAAEHPRAAPLDGASEREGEGVVAIVDGVEARLGSPSFCDLELESAACSACDPEASLVAFRHGERTAVLRLRQTLRPDARDVVAALEQQGLRVIILSGDRVPAVESVARALRVAEWRGALKPADKVAWLEKLRAGGRKALMIGDGLNDAPALAAAHVSLSPIDATQLTRAAADAVFLGERLAPVIETLDIAVRARSLMRQNLAFAMLYNALAVPLAVTGLLTPLIAAAAMSGSSLLVTLNALRAGRGVRRLRAQRSAPQAQLVRSEVSA